jgi:hypothetical protein
MTALLESNGDRMNQVPTVKYELRDAIAMCELHQEGAHALKEAFHPSLPLPRPLLKVEHRPNQ